MEQAAPNYRPPYTIGIVEDTPGERHYIIGSEPDHIWFARIPATDERSLQTIQAILRAANAHDALVAACESIEARLSKFGPEHFKTWATATIQLSADEVATLRAALELARPK